MIVRTLNSYIPSDIESIENLCPSFENLKVNNPQYEEVMDLNLQIFLNIFAWIGLIVLKNHQMTL